MAGAMLGSTIQVHLNRSCNLKCAHCYSMSGPQHREALAPAILLPLLTQARAQGYTTLSLSGGEPFLYAGLAEVAAEAKRLGMRVVGVTNGTLMNTESRRSLIGLFDLLAISVDGPEPLHNALRQSDSAYTRMLRGIEAVRDRGVPFGIIHTVTRQSLSHLLWLADFAAGKGAALLQLHPLGIVGAAADLEPMRLTGEDLARLYIAGLALRGRHQPSMRVHIDLFSREIVRGNPALVIPNMMGCGRATLLAAALNPLVVMANGDLSPICHAMHPSFRLGNLHEMSLDTLATTYLDGPFARFRSCCEGLWNELDQPDEWPYFNWYEHLESASYRRDLPGLVDRAKASASA